MLASGRPHDAAFAFERILLLVPTDAAARAGLEDAQAASAEQEQRLDEQRAAAETAGADHTSRGWFTLRRSEGEMAPALPVGSPSGRSRIALGAVCALVFVTLGVTVVGHWNGLIRQLAQAPMPHEAPLTLAAQPEPRADEQTIAAARQLLDEGEPARAVALLDRVYPEQPSYPFARHLRGQAERALRQPSAAPREEPRR